jgi:hypothetical protein
MAWVIKRTDTFLETFAQVRNNKKVIAELSKKLTRLAEDPLHVGGWLTGSLHGKKSTASSYPPSKKTPPPYV